MEDRLAKRRTRAANFTSEEKLKLMQCVAKYSDILENKQTDATTWRNKDEAWQRVTDEYNATSISGVYRQKESLKKCYENRKKEMRKIAAENRKDCFATGDDSCIPKTEPCMDVVLTITNKKTEVGLINLYDGDSSEMIPLSKKNEALQTGATIKINDPMFIDGIIHDDDNIEVLEDPLANNDNRHTEHDCGNYNEKNLRTQSTTTGRRRPKIIGGVHTSHLSEQYSNIAHLKQELFQFELEVARKKEARDVVEFELRKRSLSLDIEIKELQLKKLKHSM